MEEDKKRESDTDVEKKEKKRFKKDHMKTATCSSLSLRDGEEEEEEREMEDDVVEKHVKETNDILFEIYLDYMRTKLYRESSHAKYLQTVKDDGKGPDLRVYNFTKKIMEDFCITYRYIARQANRKAFEMGYSKTTGLVYFNTSLKNVIGDLQYPSDKVDWGDRSSVYDAGNERFEQHVMIRTITPEDM